MELVIATPSELTLLQNAATVCAWPPELKGRAVSSLTANNLNCSKNDAVVNDVTYTNCALSYPAPPVILSGPQNASILTNRNFVLGCSITGTPFPAVYWLKNGAPLIYSSRVYPQDTFNASLVFINTTVDDEGYYQCIAQNYKYSPAAVYTSEVATLKLTSECNSDTRVTP